MSQPERGGDEFPGAQLLLDQLIRLNDYQHRSMDELRVKSRAYLSVGALAITATGAFLAISDVDAWLAIGLGVALAFFVMSAILAVWAEFATSIATAPDIDTLKELVGDAEPGWSNDQLLLWAAWEFSEDVHPRARDKVLEISQRVNWQLVLFLLEIAVLSGTLIAAIAI